jgi:hypothetical protein
MGTVPSRSVALTGSRSSASPRRRRGHVLLGAMSWIVLAALWVWQLDVYVPSNWFGGVALIIVLLAGWTCFSMMWVAWCRATSTGAGIAARARRSEKWTSSTTSWVAESSRPAG